eukprot:scaffold685_cov354-Pavlova_lutheri.AAC.2
MGLPPSHDYNAVLVIVCGAAHDFCHKGCVSVGPQGGSVVGFLGSKEDVSSGRKSSRASLAKERQACTWDPDLSLAECRSGARLGDGLIIPYPLRADRAQDPLATLVLPRTVEPRRPDRGGSAPPQPSTQVGNPDPPSLGYIAGDSKGGRRLLIGGPRLLIPYSPICIGHRVSIEVNM